MTGRQYGQVWQEKDQDDRRSFLSEYKVTVSVWRDCLPDMPRGSRSETVWNSERRSAIDTGQCHWPVWVERLDEG